MQIVQETILSRGRFSRPGWYTGDDGPWKGIWLLLEREIAPTDRGEGEGKI